MKFFEWELLNGITLSILKGISVELGSQSANIGGEITDWGLYLLKYGCFIPLLKVH